MITNAADKTIDENPAVTDVSDALRSLFQQMTFTKVVKSVVDHENVEVEMKYSAIGVRQPLTMQKLLIKPEGQRAWKWEMIHALPDLVLVPDDVVVFNKTRYRVTEKWDFKEYGFVEYHIYQDYTKP